MLEMHSTPRHDEKKAIDLALNCIREVPVVVLGSGSSCAYGIRGMDGLASYLLDNVRPTDHDASHWEMFQTSLRERKHLEATLQEVRLPETLLDQVVRCTREMIAEDDGKLFERLVADSQLLPLASLFTYLFQTNHLIINVITTNYDRVAEYAACQAKYRHNTGFSHGPLRHFQCEPSNESHYNRAANFRCIDIWKVHGSIDWFQHGTKSIIGQSGRLDHFGALTPLIVTPGVEKYHRTHQDPFRTVITCADSALTKARAILCVGYGFADDHIEPKLIERARESRAPILVLARSLRPGIERFVNDHMNSYGAVFTKEGSATRVLTSNQKTGFLVPNSELWRFEKLMRRLNIHR